MSEKTIYDNPTISEKIAFEFETPDSFGSTSTNPYEISKIVIFFVSRDYASGNFQRYESEETSQKNLNEFYFREAEPVHVVGDENYPAWLSTDLENAFLENIDDCKFKYVWEPKGAREGDYFVCWTWKPLPAGDTLSNHTKFYLLGDTQQTTVLPTHQTKPKKYETLLEKYLPEMFKDRLSDSDISTDVLNRTNKSIASGFTVLEDLANQIVDLQDANATHEFLLPYLSNYFGLKLRSDDPARWRGQIKRAVPLYKKKGTKEGLTEALEHIGARLNNITRLWQVISSKTYQEAFFSDGANNIFSLEKIALLPIDAENFELWLRERDSIEWTQISESYVSFYTTDAVTYMEWVGENDPTPKQLKEGDEIRVLYKYFEVKNQNEQDLEDYIRSLPLMDIRDEKSYLSAKTKKGSDLITGLPINSELRIGQKIYLAEFGGLVEVIEIINYSTVRVSLTAASTNNNANVTIKQFEYPPKNWNVRVIREDDPMFNVVIPERNPFFDPLVFGKVRTEFPYSENIYHMEEYNGSIRDSKDPCDIDKSFVDPCYACISSSYDIDVEVESLSDDKVEETKSVIVENTPFHAVMHTCNFIGGINEFIAPPEESLEMLTTYSGADFVVAGHAQSYFYRIMLDFPTDGVKRSDLADTSSIFTGLGTCFNDSILLFCPDVPLSSSGVAPNGDSFIEIKSPSSLAGEYAVEIAGGNTLKILDTTGIEPIQQIDSPFDGGVLNTSAFVFDLNYPVDPINNSLCNIEQDNVYRLSDEGYDFSVGVVQGQIKTLKDVQNGSAPYAWEVGLVYGNFPIKDIVNGEIIIEYDSLLPSSNSVDETWSLIDNGNNVETSVNGKLKVEKRGKVTSLDTSFHPIKNILFGNDYYQKVGSIEYRVSSMVEGENDQYYLVGYDQGDMNGVSINIRKKIVKEKIGYLSYKGIRLQSAATESFLGIQNGASYGGGDLLDNNSFKENFIVTINGLSYWIHEINDDTMVLSGTPQYFGTGGESVSFEVLKYNKKEITIIGQKTYLPDHTFPTIDRDGRAVITSDVVEGLTNTVTGLSDSSEGSRVEDFVNQQEEVSFKIEYQNKEGERNE